MRISANNSDPGFANYHPEAEVWLDGVKQDHCVTADDTEGWVLLLVVNGHEVTSETKHGRVEIRLPKPIDFFAINRQFS